MVLAYCDRLSGGRLILGLGCGWHDPEYEAFGFPTDHKVGRFEEAIDLIRVLVRDGRATLEGRWVSAQDAVLLPPARPDLPSQRARMLVGAYISTLRSKIAGSGLSIATIHGHGYMLDGDPDIDRRSAAEIQAWRAPAPA